MKENLPATALYVCAIASLGLLAGLMYFRALRRFVDLLGGGHGWFAPAALTLARVAGATVVLILIARLGAMTLLAGFTGFLLARVIAVHFARRTG